PHSGTVRLTAWLAKATAAARSRVLRELGGFVARLHEACCYLDEAALTALCVHAADAPCVVLEHAHGIHASRRPQPARAARDVARLHEFLTHHGCELADWREVLHGHAAALQPAIVALPHPPDVASADEERRPSLWRRLTRGWCRLRQRPDWEEFAGPGWAERIMH